MFEQPVGNAAVYSLQSCAVASLAHHHCIVCQLRGPQVIHFQLDCLNPQKRSAQEKQKKAEAATKALAMSISPESLASSTPGIMDRSNYSSSQANLFSNFTQLKCVESSNYQIFQTIFHSNMNPRLTAT